MNGANYYDELTPDVTSYDYDALLTEDGRVTEKYRLFQAEIVKRVGPTPQRTTEDIPRMAYGEAKEVASAPLMTLAEQLPAVQSLVPRSMERLGQSYGYTLYRTTLTNEAELASIRLVDANRPRACADAGWAALILRRCTTRELLTAYTFAQPVPVRSECPAGDPGGEHGPGELFLYAGTAAQGHRWLCGAQWPPALRMGDGCAG